MEGRGGAGDGGVWGLASFRARRVFFLFFGLDLACCEYVASRSPGRRPCRVNFACVFIYNKSRRQGRVTVRWGLLIGGGQEGYLGRVVMQTVFYVYLSS